MSAAPDYAASVRFLKQYAPQGPWVLTAIAVDKPGTKTCPFKPGKEGDLLEWLEAQGASDNIYFHANLPKQLLKKKASKSDIKAMTHLHVDVDPRDGEDLDDERERIEALLRDPPGDVPPPTVIVFSGGGCQAFWKLKEPIPINGDIGKAEDAERYNIYLEKLFEADDCHNCDRIMRLPGTLNRPDKKKQAKGRRLALAEVIEFHEDRIYDIAQFPKAPPQEDGAATVQISGHVEPLDSLDRLPVPEWCKEVIETGVHSDRKYPSRSEALFAVCCELVRAGCDDDTIFSVITDERFAISESVREQRQAKNYAIRQMQRARDKAESPELFKLNEQYAVVKDVGGKCRVVSEVLDHALHRKRVLFQSFPDFEKWLRNRKVHIGETKDGRRKYMELGKWWLGHEKRQQYESIAFVPGREANGVYNLWRGFRYEPKEGDCSLYLNHLRDNVCCGNEEHYAYLINWMARAVQSSCGCDY